MNIEDLNKGHELQGQIFHIKHDLANLNRDLDSIKSMKKSFSINLLFHYEDKDDLIGIISKKIERLKGEIDELEKQFKAL